MAHLKLTVVLILLALTSPISNLKIHSLSCLGLDIEPSRSYEVIIQKSLKLFSQEPKIAKPEFLIRETGSRCYNAWVDTRKNKVILSEPVVREFSLEELAGIIAHEIAHIEFPLEDEHWKTDLRGAELTSTKIMLSKLSRMKSISANLKRVESSNLDSFDWEIQDYNFRIDKIKSHELKQVGFVRPLFW